MNILVTGISGRIGANLARALAAKGHHVRGLVWTRDARPAKLAGLPVELVEGSLVQQEDVQRAVDGMDAVCHLGAAFQGGGPFTHEEYFEINVRGTFNMLEAARTSATPLQHFFFASTDAIYRKYIPGGVGAPIREDDFPVEPAGWYALSKQLGEDLCRGYWRDYRAPVTIFRFALAVAGDELLDYGQFTVRHWLAVYAARLAGMQDSATASAVGQVHQQLQRYADQHGEQCLLVARDENGRAWKKHIADVRDIVAGFTAALGKPAVLGETFQLAAPTPFTWDEAVPAIAAALDLPFVDVRLPGQVPTYYEFDMSKGRRLFDYQPTYDISRMTEDAVAFRHGQAGDVIPTLAG